MCILWIVLLGGEGSEADFFTIRLVPLALCIILCVSAPVLPSPG
jgi:hypothetical protein